MTDTELLDALNEGQWQVTFQRGVGEGYPPWGIEVTGVMKSEGKTYRWKAGMGKTPREALEMAVKNTREVA